MIVIPHFDSNGYIILFSTPNKTSIQKYTLCSCKVPSSVGFNQFGSDQRSKPSLTAPRVLSRSSTHTLKSS